MTWSSRLRAAVLLFVCGMLGAVALLVLTRPRPLDGSALPAHTPDLSRGLTRDLTGREIGILAPIAVACVIIGVWPRPLLQTLDNSIRANIVAHRVVETPDNDEAQWPCIFPR